MSTQFINQHPVFKIVNSSVVSLPRPRSINTFWNFGSILGLCLIIQILTGLFLAIQYTANTQYAFETVVAISIDVNYGWLLRVVHANGASVFFFAVYCHVGRGIYFNRYFLSHTWFSGIAILFILIATAFLGYVLPWGQMSFWGATVITNLISAIPYVGQSAVYWLWGGFSVGNSTLTRFFTFHFILPLLVVVFVIGHLLSLHETGSRNPLGLNSNLDKIPFHPYFSVKDILGWVLILTGLFFICLFIPWVFGDSENFLIANPITTPVHIKPEWYFLFAYAILRSIPNKLGGVVALVMSILVLIVSPFIVSPRRVNSPFRKFVFWLFVIRFCVLTWIGGKPVEDPYILIGQIFRLFYFVSYIIHNTT